ncbi:uncharacterized protein MYCFIDRAFT_180353 [Pseudocercospora fijiensis CIRAD86]|uniref:Uncharacterized protein n=1 Tax=Pseudocercospora fijiensis (strain CIRAD86) TaxID=383855 RepID=M2YGT3_PSEFD|nr:uncharacterized protein MYCFIDRAFT_180353 [Pseudocercospora fijiensis CIRAD86]EME77020.1 hypothetical protein MYCFIDRAFT_180353 [Pseudocercospora fijiensis CIRAD86]
MSVDKSMLPEVDESVHRPYLASFVKIHTLIKYSAFDEVCVMVPLVAKLKKPHPSTAMKIRILQHNTVIIAPVHSASIVYVFLSILI